MITVENKLELFNKVVLEKVKTEQKALLEELEEKKQVALKKQEKESTEKADMFLRAIIDEAYEDKKTLLSQAKSEKKQRVLSQRQGLINQLADAVLKRFEAFVDGAAYEAYIDKVITTYKGDLEGFGHFYVQLNKLCFDRDVELVKAALKKVGLKAGQFEESKENIVGGCVFYNENRDVLIDASLVSLLEEHRKEIGQRMYIMLNEVGDAYDK